MSADEDMPVIDPHGRELVYVQVADHIAGRIASGKLAPGARLLAERDMADEYGVSVASARRAVQELRDRGLVETVTGKGSYVIEPTGN